MDNLLHLMPLFTVVFSSAVGYFFGIRGRKRAHIIAIAEDSLRDCYSPMYQELRLIIHSQDSEKERDYSMIFLQSI